MLLAYFEKHCVIIASTYEEKDPRWLGAKTIAQQKAKVA